MIRVSVMVDVALSDDPKWVSLTPAAKALWIDALMWVGKYPSGRHGVVDRRIIARLGGADEAVQELHEAGLWERDEKGYRFHDFDVHQLNVREVLTVSGNILSVSGSVGAPPDLGFARTTARASASAASVVSAATEDDGTFDEIWKIYPRNPEDPVGQDGSRKYFYKKIPASQRAAVLIAAQRYRARQDARSRVKGDADYNMYFKKFLDTWEEYAIEGDTVPPRDMAAALPPPAKHAQMVPDDVFDSFIKEAKEHMAKEQESK